MLLPALLSAQVRGLCWDPVKKLQFPDFRMEHPKKNRDLITVTTRIFLEYETAEGGHGYAVYSRFIPDSSSYLSKKKDEVMLEIGRMLFDLNEIYARKLRKTMSGMDGSVGLNSEQVMGIEAAFNMECREEQGWLLEDVRWGKEEDMMSIWRKKIDLRLKELDAWSVACEDYLKSDR